MQQEEYESDPPKGGWGRYYKKYFREVGEESFRTFATAMAGALGALVIAILVAKVEEKRQ